MASYSLGYGPLPWVLISELIPLRARATVGGVAVFLTWLLTFIVTKVFAPLSALIGVAGCFWIFAGFSAVSLVSEGESLILGGLWAMNLTYLLSGWLLTSDESEIQDVYPRKVFWQWKTKFSITVLIN